MRVEVQSVESFGVYDTTGKLMNLTSLSRGEYSRLGERCSACFEPTGKTNTNKAEETRLKILNLIVDC